MAKKIHVGSVQNDGEPLVGGKSLSVWLGRLILTLMGTPPSIPPQSFNRSPQLPPTAIPGIAATYHVLGMGPSALNPIIVAGLKRLYAELAKTNAGQQSPSRWSGAPFSSRDNFVMLQNENPSPGMVKNAFKTGKQTPIENNKWILGEPYYTIL